MNPRPLSFDTPWGHQAHRRGFHSGDDTDSAVASRTGVSDGGTGAERAVRFIRSGIRRFTALLVVLACGANALHAATLTVTSTADTGPDAPQAGTLRAALASAADGDTIDATGLTGTITLMAGLTNSAELVVNKSVKVLGPGPTHLTVDANHLSRVFFVNPGLTVTIEGLRIVNGEVDTSGGGIYNDHSALTVQDCTFSGNSALAGGGIYNISFDKGRATLAVHDSTLSSNLGDLGGGIYNVAFGGGNATATLSHCILTANTAQDGGGGIYSVSRDGSSVTVIVDHSTLNGNSVSGGRDVDGGGAIYNFGDFASATLTVSSSTLNDNSANRSNGGGIRNRGGARGSSPALATIVSSTLSGNTANYGGAIYNAHSRDGFSTIATVVLGNSTLSGNLAVFGGALVNDDGDATVLACTLSGNSASGHTGGISGSVPRNGVGGGSTKVGYTILKHGQGANLNGKVDSLGFNVSSDSGAGFLTGTGDLINRDPRLGPLADNGGPTLTHLPQAGSPALDRGSSDLMATLGLTTDQRGLSRLFDDPGTPNAALADGTDIGAVEVQQPTARNLFWNNLAGGNWNDAANWSANVVPGTNDNVIINLPGTVTINGPMACFGLTIGSSSNAPTLTGGGTITLHGPSAWINGTMSGSGRTVVEAGSTLDIANTSGSGALLNARTLENRGTILWSRNFLGVIGGAVITNGQGALFQAEGPAEAILGGGIAAGRIDNAGTFRKAVGSGPLTLSSGLGFNNSGTVAIEDNLLVWGGGLTNNGTVILSSGVTNRFTAGGSGNGTFFAPATALVEWTGGTFTLDGGAQLNGDGLYRISSPATVAANASITITNLDLIHGTLDGTGTVTIANVMNWSGGTMSGRGRTIIPAGAMLNATLPSGGGLNARTLENAGTIRWTGAGNLGFVSAVITNLVGATFLAEGAGGMTFVSGLNRFDNAGTFRKSVNPGTLEIVDFSRSGSFNNFGTAEIDAGTFHCNASITNLGAFRLSNATTLRLAGGGSATGTFETPATALTEWTGGSFTLHPGAQLTGPGLYRINGNSANVVGSGDVTVQNFDLVTGDSALTALSGTGRLTISHSMNWSGGTMSGAGRTFIAPEATLALTNANSIGLLRTLENAGKVAWTGSGIVGLLNGVITNQAGAVFEASNDARLAYSGGTCRFDNSGTFRKLGAAGTTTIDAGLPFNNTGTVDIQSGILAANGGFHSTGSALLNFALGGTQAGSNHGQLTSSGTITLNGALSVDFLPGYTPALNDSFTVLTAGTRAGALNQFSYLSNGFRLQLSDTPNSILLSVNQVVPPTEEAPKLSLQIQDGALQLCWPASSNATYRVEFSSDLTSTNWTTLPGNMTAENNTICFKDSLGTSHRFYRLRMAP